MREIRTSSLTRGRGIPPSLLYRFKLGCGFAALVNSYFCQYHFLYIQEFMPKPGTKKGMRKMISM